MLSRIFVDCQCCCKYVFTASVVTDLSSQPVLLAVIDLTKVLGLCVVKSLFSRPAALAVTDLSSRPVLLVVTDLSSRPVLSQTFLRGQYCHRSFSTASAFSFHRSFFAASAFIVIGISSRPVLLLS